MTVRHQNFLYLQREVVSSNRLQVAFISRVRVLTPACTLQTKLRRSKKLEILHYLKMSHAFLHDDLATHSLLVERKQYAETSSTYSNNSHTHTDTHFKFKISTSPIHSKVEKNNIQGLTGKCITPHIQSAVDTWFSEWLRKFT